MEQIVQTFARNNFDCIQILHMLRFWSVRHGGTLFDSCVVTGSFVTFVWLEVPLPKSQCLQENVCGLPVDARIDVCPFPDPILIFIQDPREHLLRRYLDPPNPPEDLLRRCLEP